MSMVPWTTRSRPVTARICASTACRKVSRLRSQDIAIRPVRATPSNATIGLPRRFIPWAIVNGISESGWIQIWLDRVLLDRAWLDQVGLNQVWSNQVRLNRNRVDVAGSLLKGAGKAPAEPEPALNLPWADPNSANHVVAGRPSPSKHWPIRMAPVPTPAT